MKITRLQWPERSFNKHSSKSDDSKPSNFRGKILRLLLRAIWAFFWRLSLVSGIILAGTTWFYYSELPDEIVSKEARSKGSITFLDMNDRPFFWWGEHLDLLTSVSEVSPQLIQAITATEDQSFFSHWGISPRGIIGAIIINIREGRGALEGHGGSTITQQASKLICYNIPYDPEKWTTPEKYERDCRRVTLWRKLKEVPFALAMELKYTKEEILLVYMNRAYLGAGATGFQAASRRYFDKNVAELDLAESALLAGLLTAPSRYTPTKNLEEAQGRAKIVASLMVKQGYISQEQSTQVVSQPAQLSVAASNKSGGHLVDWILQIVPNFLVNLSINDVVIETTYDPRIQSSLEEAVNEIFSTKIYQGSGVEVAMVTMSRDGAVRGMVGGKNVRSAGFFNRAVSAKRQTGSLFKTMVFAAGLESGLAYDDIIDDKEIRIRYGNKLWEPSNYKNEYFGPVTLVEALAQSLNSVAVRVLLHAGREKVVSVARSLGVNSEMIDGPSLALGTSEATLLEMTGAYTGILNGGWPVQAYGIKEIKFRDESDPIFVTSSRIGDRVLSGDSSRQLIYMLNQVIETGTGKRAAFLDWEVAGKTGTTQKARDAWFIGFTAEYITGVWMGYDDNTPLKGVTGGGLPAELWRTAMEKIHAGQEPVRLPMINPAR